MGLTIDVVGAYGRGVVRGIMAFAKAANWTIAIEPRWSFDSAPDVEEWNVDGVVTQVYSRAFLRRVIKSGIKATNVSNFVPAGVELPTVLVDDVAVGRVAADYLHGRGFGNFAYYGARGTGFGRLRLAGFQRRLAELGHEPLVYVDAGGPGTGDVLDAWVASLPTPIGLMGCNDEFAHRILLSCERLGIAVPESIAVLGVDDDDLLNSLVTPSLSSIRQPTDRIGFEAARLLDGLLRGEAPPPEPLLLEPGAVVTRQSTDVLAIDDAEVAAALAFIRQRGHEPIGVNDVLDHVPAGRRSLERRFRSLLGRTLLGEIQRVRVDRARALLSQTDLAMPQVAQACGFANASRFGVVFRKMTGDTPTAFRAGHRLATA